jgi:hypothetical protein
MIGEKPYYPEKDYTEKCYNCIYGGKTYDLRGEERHICGKLLISVEPDFYCNYFTVDEESGLEVYGTKDRWQVRNFKTRLTYAYNLPTLAIAKNVRDFLKTQKL